MKKLKWTWKVDLRNLREKKMQPLLLLGFFAFALVQSSILLYTQSTKKDENPLPIEKVVVPTVMNSLDEAWTLFHPSWQEESLVNLAYEGGDLLWKNTPSVIDGLIADPEQKLEAAFRPSDSLAKRVAFWAAIYSRYSSRIHVIHDRQNPAIIYGHVDLRPLYRSMDNTVAMSLKCTDFEKRILKTLKDKLLGAIHDSPEMRVEEKNKIHAFLSRIGALDKARVEELVANIRSQTGQADVFIGAIRRSRPLLPHIEAVFKTQSLPIALARIPFVESSFNPKAYSKSGAVGMWQFMPETASQMISAQPIAWMDPLKQTQAAAKLLKFYRTLVPDWGIAVTAYNSGIGRMQKLSTKYKAKTVTEILETKDSDGLGFAGQNFYAEFLAANLVEAYKEKLFEKLLTAEDVAFVLLGNNPFPPETCEM